MSRHSERTNRNLVGVHPDLVRVVRRAEALTTAPFVVIEGVRTVARQRKLVAAGASKTMNSRHIPRGTPPLAHAVDLAPLVGGNLRWDWPLFDQIANGMKAAARELNVPLEWGGDWPKFRDGPHFQLPWKQYP